MKRLAILLIAVSVIGCSTQPMSPNIRTAKEGSQVEHPVIRTPLTHIGTNGNDDLVAPFSRFQRDTVYGLDGRDLINGIDGDDELYGGNGPDHIFGYDDQDYMVGGQGPDFLSGGRHADTIEAADGQQDRVFCGDGDNDRASVDKVDEVRGCETVNGKPVAAQ